MNKTLGYVALVLATLTGVFLLWQFRAVLTLFLLALALAAAMRRPIDFLRRLGLRRGLAVILAYLAGLGLLVGLVYGFGNSLINEGQAAGSGLAAAWEHIRTAWPVGSPWQQFVAQQLFQSDAIYQAVRSALSLELVQTGLGYTLSVVDALSQVVLVLGLSIYWSIDRDRYERLWLSLLPPERRIRARAIWQGIEEGVGAHIRSTAILLMAAGVLLALGYRIMGLNAPVTLAAMAALIWLIPLLGWILGIVPAALVGLIAGPAVAALAAVYTVVVFLTLRNLVAPRLLDHRRSSPMLTVVVMLALTDVLGILGLLLAVPLAAVIHVVLSELLAPSATAPARSQPAALQLLRYSESMSAVQARVLAAQGNLTPSQLNMVERLSRLGDEVQQVLPGEG